MGSVFLAKDLRDRSQGGELRVTDSSGCVRMTVMPWLG